MQTISSQRYLNESKVQFKMKVPPDMLTVRYLKIALRGKLYRVIVDGHHNLEAAKRRGVRPRFKAKSFGIDKNDLRRFLVNNLTDSDWYDVETGEVVPELLEVE